LYFEISKIRMHIIPHPDKVSKGGEDAGYADKKYLSVADGVGGWADEGVDPGKYSKNLITL
jgi:protein phosphatase PTC7